MRMGYSVTMMGRRRNYIIPERPRGKYDYDKPEWKVYGSQRGSIKRAAMNHPIQGTNADMSKLALADMHEYIRARHLNWKLVAIVHDELVMEVPDDDAERAAATLAEMIWAAMRRFLKRVTIPEVEVHIGDCWEH